MSSIMDGLDETGSAAGTEVNESSTSGLDDNMFEDDGSSIVNKIPDEPLPNAAPISAPLPCCNNTKTINTIASETCATQTKISNVILQKI